MELHQFRTVRTGTCVRREAFSSPPCQRSWQSGSLKRKSQKSPTCIRESRPSRSVAGSQREVVVRAAAVEDLETDASDTGLGNFETSPGVPEPLGPSPLDSADLGVNFALFSQHATRVTLELFSSDGDNIQSIPLDPGSNKSGNIWHVAVQKLPLAGIEFGWRVGGEGGWETGHRWSEGKVLVDPYAPLVAGRRLFAQRDDIEQFQVKEGSVFRGTYDFESPEFDWGVDYERPNIPPQDLIIYEMCVRSFTASASSGLSDGLRGSFLGLKEKIPHLVDLGINAVELLPVMEYDELEFQRSPNPRDHMVNIWGYSHISFIAPMSRFAAEGGGAALAAREFKETVKALHRAGIEVILDVVFNHTVEGGDDDPYLLSLRGLDNSVYYMLNLHEYHQLLNYSGCGNTVSGNHPVVKDLIITACKRWVEEYHVDGFRFDLASALTRDGRGNPLAAPPLMRDIAKDPVLSKVKLLAEPWDTGGLYQVGSFPNWDVWGEWNGKYRDDTRRFIKGDGGMKSAFATRLAGSADLYHVNNRKPYHGVNFVIAHDGFTLYDLVSYNDKRNGANGEDNRDGSNDNFSWNCGAEGETDDHNINNLRQRQMKNLMLALLVSQGTPMVLSGGVFLSYSADYHHLIKAINNVRSLNTLWCSGDEYGQTRSGNNNWYGHDTEMTRFSWDKLEAAKDNFFRFYRAEFLSPSDITWYDQDWNNPQSKFIGFTLHDRGQGCGDLFVAFNAHHHNFVVHLPHLAGDRYWSRLVDTNLPPPKDFTLGGNSGVEADYTVTAYSAIMLISKHR